MRSWNTFTKATVLVFGIVLALTFRAGASTQSPAPQPNEEPLRALVSEVRSLRIAMEQQAAISPRIQLSMARLNIEEQRMTQLTQNVDEVRRELSAVVLDSKKIADRLAEIDQGLLTERDPKVRDEITPLRAELITQQKAQAAREQQLRTREIEAVKMLEIEQGRWIELNNRLDDLERLLAPAQKPQ
jgi:hypothetical protein